MIRNCDNPKCKKPYQAIRPQSRFCSNKCRAENKGKPKPERARQREFYEPPPNDPVEILRQRAAAKVSGDEHAYAAATAKWNALPPSITDPNVDTW